MNIDEIEATNAQALQLAKTDFPAARQMLLAQLANAEADPANADPDADTLPSILDALATLHVQQAAAYWLRLVDRLGPEMFNSCMTGSSFSEYGGDRSGLEPYDESDLIGEREPDSDQLEMFGDGSEDDERRPPPPEPERQGFGRSR